jgi:hypothetical protein
LDLLVVLSVCQITSSVYVLNYIITTKIPRYSILRVLFTYHYICWEFSLLPFTSVEGTLYLPLHQLRVLFTCHYICWGYSTHHYISWGCSLLTTTSVEGARFLPLHLLRVLFTCIISLSDYFICICAKLHNNNQDTQIQHLSRKVEYHSTVVLHLY